MSEAKIENAILARLGARDDVRLWKQDVGVAVPIAEHERVLRAALRGEHLRPRTVRFGLPGQADLSGITASGRRLEIEVKSPTGRLQENQKRFGAMIQRFDGIYIVAQSVNDALISLEGAGL